jgi:hypothetical protein
VRLDGRNSGQTMKRDRRLAAPRASQNEQGLFGRSRDRGVLLGIEQRGHLGLRARVGADADPKDSRARGGLGSSCL